MKIYIGADHNGFEYKRQLAAKLESAGHTVSDVGDAEMHPENDFPIYATKLVHQLLADKSSDAKGILVCGSGQGMCMAANRFKGIRASLCWNLDEARSSRNDDDSNVLCLSAKYSTPEEVEAITNIWLSTPFAAAPRFTRRIQELDNLG